jgi:hypothetical protein
MKKAVVSAGHKDIETLKARISNRDNPAKTKALYK